MPDRDLIALPDGRVVEVLDLGDPRGPVVLFLPGCPDSRWAGWLGNRPARQRRARQVAVNRPGYGRSTFSADTSHGTVAADLVAVADHLRADGFAVLGMSVGGVSALATAALHPGRVRAVTTVAAPGNVAAMNPPHHRDGMTDEQTDVVRRARLGSLRDAVAVLRPEFEAWRATMHPDDPDDARLAARWAATATGRDAEILDTVPTAVRARCAREALRRPEAYLQDAALMMRPWRFDLGAVRCPITVRHGAGDESASLRNARWLLDHVPTARGRVDPAAAHLSALHDHWDEILGELI